MLHSKNIHLDYLSRRGRLACWASGITMSLQHLTPSGTSSQLAPFPLTQENCISHLLYSHHFIQPSSVWMEKITVVWTHACEHWPSDAYSTQRWWEIDFQTDWLEATKSPCLVVHPCMCVCVHNIYIGFSLEILLNNNWIK